MLVGKFKFTPKGDQCGCSLSLNWLLRDPFEMPIRSFCLKPVSILHVLQFWVDFYLSWDPIKYGNITRINIPVDAIWTPPVGLLNSWVSHCYKGCLPFIKKFRNFGWNFRSVRTVRVVYHFPKISGLSRRARLDSSYNMKMIRNSRNL